MWKTLTSQPLIKLSRLISSRNLHCKALELNDRSIIQVAGADAGKFLQGLMTNDIKHLEERKNKSLYCMFLNTQGRILFDAIIYNGLTDESYLIECDVSCSSELVKHLSKYRVRRKISIELSDLFKPYVIFEEPPEKLYNTSIVSRDPRTQDLKWRAVIHQSNLDSSKNFQLVPPEEYTILKYKLGIGEGVKDMPPGTSFPLECNCDYLHGVSFHKGCYIGQELTARTYHTGVVRKRLMPLLFSSPPKESKNSPIVNENGVSVGKLRGNVPDSIYGLGLMRVQQSLTAGQLRMDSDLVTTHRPEWWPIEAPKDRSQLEKLDN